MKNKIFALLLVALVLFSFVSCGSSVLPKDSYSESYVSYDTAEAEPYSLYSSSSYNGKEELSTEANTTQNDLSNRKIIKNASLSFETKTYDDFMKSLHQTISENGGYIENSDIYDGGASSSYYSRSASITARIPADRYDSFMNTVGDNGSLTHKNEYVNDVTLTYVDTESRINALQTEYDALLEILAKAESVEAIIEVRSRISDIQYQLESYQSQLRKYDDLISYCTVNLYVSEVRVETVNQEKLTFGERISQGLDETFYEIGEGFRDFSVWFIVNLPFIVIYALILALVVLVIKLIVKSSKKKREKRNAKAFLNSLPKDNQNETNAN